MFFCYIDPERVKCFVAGFFQHQNIFWHVFFLKIITKKPFFTKSFIRLNLFIYHFMRFNFIFIVSVVLFTSCGNDKSKKSTKKEEKVNTIDTLSTEKKQSPFEMGLIVNEEPTFRLAYMHYRTIDGVELLPYQQTTNDLIVDYVGMPLGEGTKKKKVVLRGEDFYRSVMKNFIAYYNEDKEAIPDLQEYTQEDTVAIDEQFEDFVQLHMFNYGYTGGAHGNANDSHYLISKENGKKMLLKDVVKDVSKFTVIAEKYFRKNLELAEDADLQEEGFWFETGFKCNENFYFNDGKMIFVYNQYEIAPYAAGVIYNEIPISKIKDLLKLEF